MNNPITTDVQAAIDKTKNPPRGTYSDCSGYYEYLDVKTGETLANAVESLAAEVERLRDIQRESRMSIREFIAPRNRKDFDKESYRLIFGQPFTGPDIESPEVLALIYGKYWKQT